MKRTFFIISILSLFLISSCKEDDKTKCLNDHKQENIKTVNDLFSFGKIHKGFFEERNKYIRYNISLDVVNISNNIFEKTVIQTGLKLVLQNGNILTAKDSDRIFNHGSFESITFWKQKETKVIGKNKELYTQSLPNHFKEYPIKQAVLVLELTTKDVINNTEETIIHNIDITEDWKGFMSKKKEAKTSINKKESTSDRTKKSIIEHKQNVINSSIINDLLLMKNESKDRENKIDKDTISHFKNDGNMRNSWGLNGRSLVSHNTYRQNCNESGTVVIQVIVNQQGIVTSAKLSVKGTTNSAPCLVEPAIRMAKSFKWRADSQAPQSQTGFIVVDFRVGG